MEKGILQLQCILYKMRSYLKKVARDNDVSADY